MKCKKVAWIASIISLGWLLIACDLKIKQEIRDQPTSIPSIANPNIIATPIASTITTIPVVTPEVTPTFTQSPSPEPTQTLTIVSSETSTNTPQPLHIFQSNQIRNDVAPVRYLVDECDYLKKRWSSTGSRPGTVVVPIMFHIVFQDGRTNSDPKEISESQFLAFISYAKTLGFETITTDQLIAFLEENDYIPPRAMIMIVDDRRPGVINNQFMPILEANNWTVTAAYIADPNSLEWAWEWMEQLYQTGRVDVQSHGYTGQLYITSLTPEEMIRKEIFDSTPVLEEHFHQRPLAFIWPGGNFTSRAVQIARQGGYKLGFTAYSRGPVMFNWIPLGDEEQQVNDPLMVLPRAWSNSANVNLDQAVSISNKAYEEAIRDYPSESEWYRTYCGGELPALDSIQSATWPK